MPGGGVEGGGWGGLKGGQGRGRWQSLPLSVRGERRSLCRAPQAPWPRPVGHPIGSYNKGQWVQCLALQLTSQLRNHCSESQGNFFFSPELYGFINTNTMCTQSACLPSRCAAWPWGWWSDGSWAAPPPVALRVLGRRCEPSAQ